MNSQDVFCPNLGCVANKFDRIQVDQKKHGMTDLGLCGYSEQPGNECVLSL